MADCRLNIYLKLQDNLRPNTDHTGHFDLQIMKDNLTLLGKVYHNPHISYGTDGVTITNGEAFNLYEKCLKCYLPFTATDAQIESLRVDNLEKYCYSTSTPDVYTVKTKSGAFESYSKERYNCFGAVAQWCELLGYSKLMEIYNTYTDDDTGYKNYTAWPIFKKYYMYWVFDDLNTEGS